MIEFFIAMKHIKERKRQSIIAILGITIGITVLTVAIGIANGLDSNMINSILSMTPHINATNTEVSIDSYEEMKEIIEKIPGVESAMPKYATQGIIKYEGDMGTFVSGVMIWGIDSEGIKNNLKLEKKIIKGNLNFDDLLGIIIGKELFEQIGASVGDKIKIVSPESKELYFNISGVFQSGFYDFDTSMVIIPLKSAQILSDSGDIVTGMDIKIKNVYKASEIAGKITLETGLGTKTWAELNKNLLYALSLEKTVMVLVLSLIIMISGFVVGVILNTLVREKTKDIGILRSIGFGKENIMKIFLIEGFFLGIGGVFTGISFSLIIIFLLKTYSFKLPLDVYYLDKLPVEIGVVHFAAVAVSTIFIIFASSIFPALKASKLTPVEALKYE